MNAEDKRVAAKQALESKYTRVNKLKQDRELRMQNLKDKMAQIGLDPEKQSQAVDMHHRAESEHLRAQRLKLTVADFEQLDIIGRGAFGEVRALRTPLHMRSDESFARTHLPPPRSCPRPRSGYVARSPRATSTR